MCSHLMFHYEADCEGFLSWIITGDETSNHHFELQTKRQSVDLHYPVTLWKNFKAALSAGKVMTAVYLGCRKGDFGSHCAMWSDH